MSDGKPVLFPVGGIWIEWFKHGMTMHCRVFPKSELLCGRSVHVPPGGRWPKMPNVPWCSAGGTATRVCPRCQEGFNRIALGEAHV